MKIGLLFLAVVAALLTCTPAHGQFVFLDLDGDGRSWWPSRDGRDVLNSSVASVDVYFVTDKNADGSDAVCTSSADPFTISSYEFTLYVSHSGSVAFGTWTDNMGFTNKLTPCAGEYCSSGTALWLAYGSGVAVAPGKYKVGTLSVLVTGVPVLNVVPGYAPLSVVSETAFASACLGSNSDHTIRLGIDFTDAAGSNNGDDTVSTTWGRIKELYH